MDFEYKPRSNIQTAWTMALFRERWRDIAQYAGPTIESLEDQKYQNFIVDVAYDKPEVREGLIELFNKHAPTILKESRLVLTPLELSGDKIDNNQVAFQRFGHYFEKRRKGINHLFAGDLDDIFPEDYMIKMRETLNAGALVAIANQVAFERGDNDWRDGQAI